MKKAFIIVALLLGSTLSALAQDMLKFGQARKEADPTIDNTKSVVAFVTSNDNFRVTPQANIDIVRPVRQTADGKYVTEVVCDLAAHPDRARSFKILIKGTSLGDYTKQVVEPGKRLYVEVTNTEEHNLYFNVMDTERGYFKEGGVAGIEFSVPDYIDNPKVDCTEGIGHVTESKAGNGVNIVTFEVNIAKLKAARAAYNANKTAAEAKVKQAEEALKAFYDYGMQHMDDEGYDFDKADKEKEQKQAALDQAYSELEAVEPPFINLYADKSNAVPVNIERFIDKLTSPKSLLQINVGDGMHVETKFDRSYNQLRAQADREYRQRKYNAAMATYRNAAADPSATEYEKQDCMSYAGQMEELSQAKAAAYNKIRAINELKKKGGVVDFNQLEELYNAAIVNFRHLYQDTQDPEYQTMVNKLNKAIQLQIVSGVVTRGGYHQGQGGQTSLTGVDIYGVFRYDRKTMKEGKPVSGAEKIGSVDEKGLFRVDFEKRKYVGLLFVPTNLEDLKNDHNQYYPLDGTKHMNLKVRFQNDKSDGKALRKK